MQSAMFHNPGRVSTNLTHKHMDKTILCLLHDGNKVVPSYLNLSKNISRKILHTGDTVKTIETG